MPERKNLFGYSLSKLTDELVSLGQSKFRARQLFAWIYGKGVYDFDAMSDIAKSFRGTLKSDYCLELPEIHTKQKASDGTVKLLLEMEDGAKVETVLMRYNYGNVACISSQVGCAMGCQFCASGLLKKTRNLEAHEMVGQVLTLNSILKEEGESISHVVVMGTGEPFDNYENVLEAVRVFNEQYGLAIGARHITVSTCGLPAGIKRYGEEGIQVNLAISLHAPNDEIRNQIMPISKAYPMDQLMEAIRQYQEKADRRVTFEYILLKGLNDQPEHAQELADLIYQNHVYAYVNLIPYNEVKEKPYQRSPNNAIHAFHDILMKRGISTTVRKEFGSDIDAACGQLRAKIQRQGGS
ncbi:MAG: 23S rRNA (adenine(2503)-C(2))-methyltransferase RlmN [Bacillota bacterium]|nr:23S rRNA (adenine(2503)-C(2))-methyltransferase RlmN [Bacillota bacterium]